MATYLKLAPIGVELETRGKVIEIKSRKVTVEMFLLADGVHCASGTVIMVVNSRTEIKGL